MVHPPERSPHEIHTKHDPCLQLSHYDDYHCCGDLFEFASQRRLGADRWASTRNFVSHECGNFVEGPFSSIESFEALRASPALGPFSLIVESRPKPLCCSTGDKVAVDAVVESPLLCLMVLVSGRPKGPCSNSQRKHRHPEQSVLEEASCSTAKRAGMAACRQDCTASRLAV